jgi:predicted metal-dependent hydrolase
MKKNERVAEMVRKCEGRGVDPHYAAYFEYFNRGEYYEAHDVLEQLWLPIRKGSEGAFYKGLIQLAGSFVHVQKNRPGPAAALLKLARHNVAPQAPIHQRLDVGAVLELIDEWLAHLEAQGAGSLTAPKLELLPV